METPITLWLDEADYAALTLAAQRYGHTTDEQARIWILGPLAEARRHWDAQQWEARRRVLAMDARLAATVDAAISEAKS